MDESKKTTLFFSLRWLLGCGFRVPCSARMQHHEKKLISSWRHGLQCEGTTYKTRCTYSFSFISIRAIGIDPLILSFAFDKLYGPSPPPALRRLHHEYQTTNRLISVQEFHRKKDMSFENVYEKLLHDKVYMWNL